MSWPARSLVVLTAVLAGAVLSPRDATVKAQRPASRCAVINAAGPAFGSYNQFDPRPNDSVGSISFQCEDLAPGQSITLELGRGRQGTIDRSMRSGGQRLDYNMYIDASRTRIWGDGTRGTAVQRVVPPNGLPVSLPIYGRIPPAQAVTPGFYSDTVQVVMLY